MLKKKSNYAFQNHIDLGFLGKPGFNPKNFDVKSFLCPNGQLVSVNDAFDILVEKPDFLNNYTNGLVVAEGPDFDYTHGANSYIFVYINELGVYGICKKTTVMFMLTKLFFDIELDKQITDALSFSGHHVERYNLKEINAYLNKPLNNYSYVYEYAAQIADKLIYTFSVKVNPYVYRFRNNYQTHRYYQDNETIKEYGCLYYLNIDYNDDLILLEPDNYDPIYINTNGYFYYAYTEDDCVLDMLKTI